MVSFRLFLASFVVVVTSFFVSAQITHSPNPLLQVVHPDSLDNKLEINFTNSKDSTYNVYWKLEKDAATWNADWSTYICDLEVCYNINQDKSSPNLPNRFTKGKHKFEFHFLPKNKAGSSTVKLILYKDKAFTQELYSCTIYLFSWPAGTFYHTPNSLNLVVNKDTLDKKMEITFTNTKDTVYNVYWKLDKDPATWNPAWSTYICDLEVCYNINQDKSSPNLPNKFNKGSHKFEFHFLHNNADGCSAATLRLFGDKTFTNEIYSVPISILNCLSSSSDIQLNAYVLYPNPATDVFTLSGVEEGQDILVFSGTGHLMISYRSSQGGSYDVSSLLPGIYHVLVKGSAGKQASVSKLVIE